MIFNSYLYVYNNFPSLTIVLHLNPNVLRDEKSCMKTKEKDKGEASFRINEQNSAIQIQLVAFNLLNLLKK